MAHAKLSPSGAHRWMACPGSVVLEAQYPDEGSSYAREGSAAHELAAIVLEEDDDLAANYIGKKVEFFEGDDPLLWDVTQSMADHVDDYVRLVREYAEGGTLMVEQRLGIGHITGEEGAKGTSDVVIVKGGELIVIDLKFGMGVKVDAADNPQLQLYALGALNEFDMLGDFHTVTMVVHQPRLNHVSEWSIPVAQLREFALSAEAAANITRDAEDVLAQNGKLDWMYLNPGEKQCKFCKAKSSCPALRAEITEVVGGSAAATIEEFAEFTPETVDMQTGDNYLPIAMSKVELVEQWCKAVRAEVERRLLAGQPVDGYKLVEGKRGSRKWSSEADVEALFKSFRLRQDEMYDFSLISPTKAEKLFKENPKRWSKVLDLVTQSSGKPSVAPATDKRQEIAVQSVADDFRDLLQTDN